MKYAIIDIETTGGSPKHEKITEIAIYLHNGTSVTGEFQSLINPEKVIPPFITGLTGITNEMVANAPRFYEIAREIVELTEGCTLVGHNVSFDYAFIKNEFSQLGYAYSRKTLCTVKLSRKLLPGYTSYSLGKLCKNLKIQINGRHRASGDAYATVLLFQYLLKQNELSTDNLGLAIVTGQRLKNLNGYLKPSDIDALPNETGVYYLYDCDNNLLYVGKSTHIHDRILGHLGNRNTRKSTELALKIAGISYELTGSELIALLKESSEIKKNKPFYNRAQKRTLHHWGLYSFRDKEGYVNFRIKKTSESNEIPLTGFNNITEARSIMNKMVEKYWLCQKLSGLYDTDEACFHFGIRQCNGACIGKESPGKYNERAARFIEFLSYQNENMLIIDKGRGPTERSVICIENGHYCGYGFVNTEESYLSVESLKECIDRQQDNRDIHHIIHGWLRKNKPEKIIRY